jgi:hypothetical protein
MASIQSYVKVVVDDYELLKRYKRAQRKHFANVLPAPAELTEQLLIERHVSSFSAAWSCRV